MTGFTRCAEERHAVAGIQGELTSEEQARFDEHLLDCASCRAFVSDAERLLGPRVNRADRPAKWPRLVAAGLLVGVIVELAMSHFGSPSTGVPDLEQDPGSWLVQTQLAAGSWGPEASAGLGAQEVAAHALGLLALIERDAGLSAAAPVEQVSSRRAIEAAAGWLAQAQEPGGLIGLPLDGGYCDHALATLALLRATEVIDNQGVSDAARAALGHLLDQQLASGAWERRPGRAGPQFGAARAALQLAADHHLVGADGALARADRVAGPEHERFVIGDNRAGLAALGTLPHAAALVLAGP